MEAVNQLAAFLLRLGRGWAESSIVAVSVVGSLLLTSLALLFLPGEVTIWRESLVIAVLVPVAVATPVSLALMSLLRELEKEAHHLANTDLLTGLFNRRRWIALAERAVQRAAQGGTPLALLMLDVDNFKQVNDIHGHQVGDGVLRAVADACGDGLRPLDAVARWGGEEFVMLLPDTGVEEATRVAERLRETISAITMENHGCRVPVTVSIGVASSDDDPSRPDLEELLHAADCAMYSAKQAGKNLVGLVAPPPKGPAPLLRPSGFPR